MESCPARLINQAIRLHRTYDRAFGRTRFTLLPGKLKLQRLAEGNIWLARKLS